MKDIKKNELPKKGIWKEYIDWLKGKSKVIRFLKIKRYYLLFIVFFINILGFLSLQEKDYSFVLFLYVIFNSLIFFFVSTFLYFLDKRASAKRIGISVEQIKTNYLLWVIIATAVQSFINFIF